MFRAIVAASVLGLFGCQDDRECEAARLALTRTWETLRDTAASRKQIPETTELPKSQEEARIRVWTGIEEEAELMRSSFETRQVTWASAEKARSQLSELFKPLAVEDDVMTRGFAATLASADQQLEKYRNKCR